MWYRTGTVTVTNGSAVVTGAGTDFVGFVSVGEIFVGPDLRIYEVTQVVSATDLRITPVYQAGTAGGQGYAIAPTQSFARDLALSAAALLNTFGDVRDGVGQGLFPDGTTAAPGGRFRSDQDTGWRRAGENILALVAGGVDRLYAGPFGATVAGRVTAAQADTIGVEKPQLGGLSPSAAFFSIAQTYGLLIGSYGSNGNTWMQVQRVDGTASAYNLLLQPSGGNVGIGTTTPIASLDIEGTPFAYQRFRAKGSAGAREFAIGVNFSSTGTFSIYDYTTIAERFAIEPGGHVRPGADNGQNLGGASNRWATVYAGTGSINTSDEREKDDIGAIPTEWLDAWGDVQWCRYRFRDAMAEKGDQARWHLGMIAQQVRDAFAARDLDALEIGLLCRDEWAAAPAVAEVRSEVAEGEEGPGEIVTPAKPARKAGDRWGLRYDECQAIEAAWQRRRIGELEAAVAALTAQQG